MKFKSLKVENLYRVLQSYGRKIIALRKELVLIFKSNIFQKKSLKMEFHQIHAEDATIFKI